jgi:transcriptional regulator with GAF, ATPase, and Fis domain
LPKQLIFALGIAVIVFAVVVLGYAHQANDIGLSCAFNTLVQRVQPSHFRPEFAPDGPPTPGDQVTRVGTMATHTWSDYLRSLADLPTGTAGVPELTSGSDLAQLEGLAARGITRVRLGNSDLIRLEFSRDLGSGERATYHCWAEVGSPPWSEFVPSLIWFALKFGLFLVGAIVYWQRPNDRAAAQFFLLCIFTVGAFMGGYHWARIAANPVLAALFMVFGVFLPAVSLHFYLIFPHPKPVLERWPRLTMGLVYGLPSAVLACMLGILALMVWHQRVVYSPAMVAALSAILLNVVFLAVGMSAVWFAGCVTCLLHSYLRSPPRSRERQQVQWIFGGTVLAAFPIAYTLYLAVFDREAFGFGGATWPMFLASVSMTSAYGVSISRYGMMDVRQVLNWGLLSLAVSLAAGLIYSLLVFTGMWFLGTQGSALSPLWQAIWVSVTAWVMLSLVDSARWRLRQAVNQRLNRTKFSLDQTMRRMTLAVEQQVDAPTLCRRFLHALSELVHFQQGSIYLRTGEPPIFRLVTNLGTEPPLNELPPGSPLIDALQQVPLVRVRPGAGAVQEPSQRQLAQLHAEIALPLRHDRGLLAVILIGPSETESYDFETVHLLTAFTQIMGMALHGAQGREVLDGLSRELQEKITKISEQQRRIVALQSQLSQQRKEPTPPGPDGIDPPRKVVPAEAPLANLVGGSQAMQQLAQIVRKVAGSNSAVLIRGESGTGKELIAQALHDLSPRSHGPFVKVHCAALSAGLLESELFGHVKGAFTGAVRDKVGRFELAHGGTLFLDEIGDISLEVQTKLLRVLQEMTFERVGSSQPINVDVRIIAATNQNLEKAMKDGRFREDLFYRLNVITIRTPPLRERREDIAEIAAHFVKVYAGRSNKPDLLGIDDDGLAALKGYDWPGNVRELENVIERAAVLADGPTITLDELPDEVRGSGGRERLPRSPRGLLREPTLIADGSYREWLAEQEETERQQLVQALASTGGNKSRAARELGLPRSTFISKLEKHGLLPKRG